MKTARIALLLSSSALFSACTYVPSLQGSPRVVSPDYTATGQVRDARAYVYGDRTVLEFDADPFFLSVRDSNGVSVAFEKLGRYYRLARRLDTFTAQANGQSVTFSAAVVTRVFSASLADPAPALVHTRSEPVMDSTTEPVLAKLADTDVAALLTLSETQINEVRHAIDAAQNNPHATSAEYAAVNARLDEIQARLVTAAAAIVNVSFPSGSTTFKPSAEVAKVLIGSAKAADRVIVHGHTDARMAGPMDPRIALGRALAARKFLMANGVNDDKIKVFAQADGDFAAPNATKEGRALNRRVEVEFVDSRIANLKRQAVKLAGK